MILSVPGSSPGAASINGELAEYGLMHLIANEKSDESDGHRFESYTLLHPSNNSEATVKQSPPPLQVYNKKNAGILAIIY